MEVYRGYMTVPAGLGKTVVTIGNFDGVHRGHQALFRDTVAAAARLHAKSTVFTFEPHPVRILNPSLAPPRITPEAEKVRLIGASGVDLCIVEPFTPELAALPADEFVKK